MSRPTSSPSPRHQGGQPGNHNHFKHGFYSQQLSTRDTPDLSALSPYSVDPEIALMRVLLRRILASSRGVTSFLQLAALLRGFTHAVNALSRLVRIRYKVYGHADENTAALLDEYRRMVLSIQDRFKAEGKIPFAFTRPVDFTGLLLKVMAEQNPLAFEGLVPDCWLVSPPP